MAVVFVFVGALLLAAMALVGVTVDTISGFSDVDGEVVVVLEYAVASGRGDDEEDDDDDEGKGCGFVVISSESGGGDVEQRGNADVDAAVWNDIIIRYCHQGFTCACLVLFFIKYNCILYVLFTSVQSF